MKTRVCHIITRLIQGGAQENTVATVELLNCSKDFEADLITGPAIGPEGTLIPYAEERIKRLMIVNELRRQINPFYDTAALCKLVYLLRKGAYDIVHTHSSKAGILGRIAARIAGVKTIVHTIHGLPFHPYQSAMLNHLYISLEKIVAPRTDRIVTVADAMTQKAVAAGVAAREKFVTVYSGMDLDAFLSAKTDTAQLRRTLGIREDDVVICKVSRLYHLKGHEYVIDAARDIVRTNPAVKFLFVGGGTLRSELEGLVKKYGLEKHVVFVGLVNHDHVPKYLQAVDIVAHTSLREGLARVLPQACACGKPVVAFDIDGAREVVKDGVTGFLVPAKDTGRLCEAFIKLITDKPLRVRMGENGKKLVDPVFRNEYMADRIMDVYRDVSLKTV
jgi:glycosyltransferase involved in cell wall biosynthesis